MSSSKNGTPTSTDTKVIRVKAVAVTASRLKVDFDDGRRHLLPLSWYPRLAHGTVKERNTWQLIAKGYGVHWPLLDEDLSAEGLLAGAPSGESTSSFENWLSSRPKAGKVN
ncbi:DUF2442 domain-containing protein [Synoicihabitans lomoniglobus]|uniref:DUF2442 domain-containing protein n=1 Tax=Synoicihabitans lomoniglobus TaxID=2909285 RepID=A0AAE9ZWF5_9BACT|nr:DUF2442 domain-containing protein [Opitutaceae bacterium LMO-M01]WED63773.1 DUF2442 domain-containing protein [Opitutaceae bacterium LMO-M01]